MLCDDMFRVPLHFKQGDLYYKKKPVELRYFLQKRKSLEEQVDYLHQLGEQILRMERSEVV